MSQLLKSKVLSVLKTPQQLIHLQNIYGIFNSVKFNYRIYITLVSDTAPNVQLSKTSPALFLFFSKPETCYPVIRLYKNNLWFEFNGPKLLNLPVTTMLQSFILIIEAFFFVKMLSHLSNCYLSRQINQAVLKNLRVVVKTVLKGYRLTDRQGDSFTSKEVIYHFNCLSLCSVVVLLQYFMFSLSHATANCCV